MSKALLERTGPGRIQVYGLLSVDTVASYQQKGFEMLVDSDAAVVFDLSEAEVVGSAVIALLISWQRKALNLNKDFSIVNAPEHLLEIAEVSGVRQIIAFEG